MNILKPSVVMMICWVSVIGGAHAATYQKTLVIPAINNAPVSWPCTLAPDEDAALTFEPGASPPGYCYQGMEIKPVEKEGFCWVGSCYIINAEHKSATATVIATCTWVPCPGPGGGGSGPGPQIIINTGIGTAEAKSGTYWITAGNNVLAIGDPNPVTVNAYKNMSIDAPSTWTHSPKLDLVPKSTSADVTGIASSSMPGDAWVRGDSTDYDLFDEEYFTVVELLSIEADPEVVCVDGEVSYEITTQPEGYNYMVSYTPADTSTPGVKQVIATCGSSAATCTVTVIKVEITPPQQDACVLGDDITFQLSATSYAPGGVTWKIEPMLTEGASIISYTGTEATIDPGGIETSYTVTATSVLLADCADTADLAVSCCCGLEEGDKSQGIRVEINGAFSITDRCDNVLSVTWDYPPNLLMLYNNEVVGACCYNGGNNVGHYYMTKDGCRFYSTFWENVDDSKDGGPMDEGTPFKWDWTRYSFDCLSDTLAIECLESATQRGGPASPETQDSECELCP